MIQEIDGPEFALKISVAHFGKLEFPRVSLHLFVEWIEQAVVCWDLLSAWPWLSFTPLREVLSKPATCNPNDNQCWNGKEKQNDGNRLIWGQSTLARVVMKACWRKWHLNEGYTVKSWRENIRGRGDTGPSRAQCVWELGGVCSEESGD